MDMSGNFIVLSLILITQVSATATYKDDVQELIQNAGYQSEVHKVETEDGYLLNVHRVVVKKESLVPREPVFIMHGLASTAMDFVLSGADIAIGNGTTTEHVICISRYSVYSFQ